MRVVLKGFGMIEILKPVGIRIVQQKMITLDRTMV